MYIIYSESNWFIHMCEIDCIKLEKTDNWKVIREVRFEQMMIRIVDREQHVHVGSFLGTLKQKKWTLFRVS